MGNDDDKQKFSIWWFKDEKQAFLINKKEGNGYGYVYRQNYNTEAFKTFNRSSSIANFQHKNEFELESFYEFPIFYINQYSNTFVPTWKDGNVCWRKNGGWDVSRYENDHVRAQNNPITLNDAIQYHKLTKNIGLLMQQKFKTNIK